MISWHDKATQAASNAVQLIHVELGLPNPLQNRSVRMYVLALGKLFKSAVPVCLTISLYDPLFKAL